MTTRRGFIQGLLALATSQAIPFNRVWSFPKEIVIAKPKATYLIGKDAVYTNYYSKLAIDDLKRNTPFLTYNVRYTTLPPIDRRELKLYTLENI